MLPCSVYSGRSLHDSKSYRIVIVLNHPLKDLIDAYCSNGITQIDGCSCSHCRRVDVELQLDFWILLKKFRSLKKYESWTRGPPALGGPLDFVHPCPMVVTPLDPINIRSSGSAYNLITILTFSLYMCYKLQEYSKCGSWSRIRTAKGFPCSGPPRTASQC